MVKDAQAGANVGGKVQLAVCFLQISKWLREKASNKPASGCGSKPQEGRFYLDGYHQTVV